MIFVEGKKHPVRADSIEVGDRLRADHGTHVTVKKIQKITRKGVYAPLTPGGSLVVNGIVASAYPAMQDTDAAEFSNGVEIPYLSQHMGCHMWMSPMRLLCMGVSSGFCDSSNNDDDGLMPWIEFGERFLHWSLNQSAFLQALLFAVSFVSFAFLNLIEIAFEPVWGASVLLAAALGWLLLKRCRLCLTVKTSETATKFV